MVFKSEGGYILLEAKIYKQWKQVLKFISMVIKNRKIILDTDGLKRWSEYFKQSKIPD